MSSAMSAATALSTKLCRASCCGPLRIGTKGCSTGTAMRVGTSILPRGGALHSARHVGGNARSAALPKPRESGGSTSLKRTSASATHPTGQAAPNLSSFMRVLERCVKIAVCKN